MSNLFESIFEDDTLLVINKPAGLVCHPTKGDAWSSLVGRVRLYLGDGVHFHLINRLDRETSGVVVVAKTDEAARNLRQLWDNGHVCKDYIAMVHGHLVESEGVIDAPLGRDVASRVAIKDCVGSDGARANTGFRLVCRFFRQSMPFSLVEIRPKTGRKHQIRIHLAHLGHSIVGDKLYGGDEDLYLAFVEGRLSESARQRLILPFHALHACRLSFPWKGVEMEFEAVAEPWFREFIAGDGDQTPP